MTRPVILTLCDFYRPGYRAGGTVRSLEAIVATLGDEFDFRIVTRDRDLGASKPYADIKTDRWQEVGGVQVLYMSRRSLTPAGVRHVIASTPHDILYLNSLFSVPFSIYPLALRKLGFGPARPVIIAPRGETSPGAMELKHRKKAPFIWVSRRLRLFDGVSWQASNQAEQDQIRVTLGARSQVFISPDLALTRSGSQGVDAHARPKEPGSLRAVFLSRISPKKNLDGALSILEGVRGHVELAIYGPIEDSRYWRKCQSAIEVLPPNVSVHYRGELSPEAVPEALASHDLLFLPTLGENYGHVILEAMAVGLPVLISDRTPWRHLKDIGVGWDISLDWPDEFRRVLDDCTEMDSSRWQEFSRAAIAFAGRILGDPKAPESNRALFNSTLKRSTTARLEPAGGASRR